MKADHLLSPEITVHCFWRPRCPHIVSDRPVAAHERMEEHYKASHVEDIRKVIGWAS